MIPSSFLSKTQKMEKRQSRINKRPFYADKIHAFLIEKSKGLTEDDELHNRLRLAPNTIDMPYMISRNKLIDRELGFG
jgi:hypothetical protein